MRPPAETVSEFYNGLVNGFLGACGRFLRGSDEHRLAALWLLADHALLAAQEPAYVTVWRNTSSGFVPVYSSIADEDRSFLGLCDLSSEAHDGEDVIFSPDSHTILGISIRSLPRKDGKRIRPAGLDVQTLIATLKRLLDVRHDDLLVAVDSYARLTHQPSPALSVGPYDDFGAVPHALVETLRDRVGRVLDDIGSCELTEKADGERAAPNLFAVVRLPSRMRIVVPPAGRYDDERREAQYPYSVGLLLSEAQRRRLVEDGRDVAALERELGRGSRSIADTPLCQGNIDFSSPDEHVGSNERSRQFYPDERSGVATREDREGALYEMVRTVSGPRSIFYIPIHLGGHPWMAVFTFNTGSPSADTMMRNFLIYRDLVPLLSEGLSRAVQDAFAASVASIIVKAFDRAGGTGQSGLGVGAFTTAANAELAVLGRLYPYQRPYLALEGSDEERLSVRLGDEVTVFLRWTGRPPRLSYRLLDTELVKRSVEREIQLVLNKTQLAYRDALQVFGHYLGGLIQESGFNAVLAEGEQVALRHPDASPLADLLRFADSRIAIVSGLGEAMRLRKSQGRGLPHLWFPKRWAAPSTEELLRAASGICLFYAAPRWKQARAGWICRIQYREHQSVLDEKAKSAPIVGSDLPELPPFKGPASRKSGTVALTLGLAELIRNACAVVDANAGSMPVAALAYPLVDIGLDIDEEAQCLKITVDNVTRHVPSQVVSITEVQFLESLLMRVDGESIVETRSPSEIPRSAFAKIDLTVARGEWRYYFGRVRVDPISDRTIG